MADAGNLGTTAEGLVMIGSETMPAGTPVVRGPDFNDPATATSLDALLGSFATMGFQASALAAAVDEVNALLNWRLSDEPVKPTDDDALREPAARAAVRATVWLGMTSNMVSSGQREVVRYLAQHKLVDVIVCSAGAVEEDIMKTLAPHFLGDFALAGRHLRMRGLNRLGNLVVPNSNYVAFEDWFTPVLDAMHDEQDAADAARRAWAKAGAKGDEPERLVWSPSTIIERLGRAVGNPDSIWHWCALNKIPVFCPGLTDGAIGDMLYFHDWKRNGFVVDIAKDVRRINDIAVRARHSGMVILGGGLVKHHVCNANLMRNGADRAVFINTASDYDGSDTGARPDEAVSWGKIKLDATPVKVTGDATILFPLLVSQTFAKYVARGCTPEPGWQAAAAARAKVAAGIASVGTPRAAPK
jgi:deoxyhypusine synthase